MNSQGRYPQATNRYVIETTHGVYTEDGWGFCTSRKSLKEAFEFCNKWKSGYRVYDSVEDRIVERME